MADTVFEKSKRVLKGLIMSVRGVSELLEAAGTDLPTIVALASENADEWTDEAAKKQKDAEGAREQATRAYEAAMEKADKDEADATELAEKAKRVTKLVNRLEATQIAEEADAAS